MAAPPVLARRLLLRQLGTGAGVFGTFLLPGAAAAVAALRPTPRHPAPWHPARWRPPLWYPPNEGPRSASRQLPPLVMLDPGHGGRDPGAIGVSGTYEKHIALEAAYELHRLLEASGRYRVAMTRARDVFIPLEQRVAIAREHGASLFVSMHADALSHDRAVRGASVYTFAAHASDAQTARIAASENAADRFAGRAWHGAAPQVARILASLMRRETRVDSAHLADRLVHSLAQDVPMLTNPERHAGFVVLQSAEIPSVLVEMGFMSNPADEAALRRPAHRAKVALAMRDAVDGYFAAAGHMMAG